MELLKGGACSKALFLALVIIALISPPDQCEAVKCYESTCVEGQPGCENSKAIEKECSQDPPCLTIKYFQQGQVQFVRDCNEANKCLTEKFQFGVGVGCKEQPGTEVNVCYPGRFEKGETMKYCTCSGHLCNGDDITTGAVGTGNGGGSGGNSGGSSLKWTVTETGLMMASMMCVAAAGGL